MEFPDHHRTFVANLHADKLALALARIDRSAHATVAIDHTVIARVDVKPLVDGDIFKLELVAIQCARCAFWGDATHARTRHGLTLLCQSAGQIVLEGWAPLSMQQPRASDVRGVRCCRRLTA